MVSLAMQPDGGPALAFLIFLIAVPTVALFAIRYAIRSERAHKEAQRAHQAYVAQQWAAEQAHAAHERARVEHERKLLEYNDSLGLMLAQTPAEFEEATAVILSQLGYQLRRVGKAGDLGADLVGADGYGHGVIVQCKRYAPGNKVGTPAVQSFIGMHHRYHRAAVGVCDNVVVHRSCCGTGSAMRLVFAGPGKRALVRQACSLRSPAACVMRAEGSVDSSAWIRSSRIARRHADHAREPPQGPRADADPRRETGGRP
jgi:hypothetical protein